MAKSTQKNEPNLKTPFLLKSSVKILKFPLFSALPYLSVFRTSACRAGLSAEASAKGEALRRRMARNTRISPEQTQFRTALKYQLINNLRNICGNFPFKSKPDFQLRKGGFAREKCFSAPTSGPKRRGTAGEKTIKQCLATTSRQIARKGAKLYGTV
jgi:hypothetical protein